MEKRTNQGNIVLKTETVEVSINMFQVIEDMSKRRHIERGREREGKR